METRSYFTEGEALALLGKEVRAKKGWSHVPPGSDGVIEGVSRLTDWGWIVIIAWHTPAGLRAERFNAHDYRRHVEEV
jgi:hypothetical protein